MSDTTTDPIETEVITSNSLDSQVRDSAEPEGAEEGGDTPPEPAPFRAWEHKPQNKIPDHIPYGRFKEVNEERKEALARVEAYEARLAELQARQEELERVKDPDEINIDDFDDPKEYLKARDKAIRAAAVREIEERFVAREQANIQAQHLKALDDRYVENINKAAERNPEVRAAADFIHEYASHIPPAVAHEIMIDPNAGELLHAIATNQQLLTALFRGNPNDTIRALHKLSAKIDLQNESGSSAAASRSDVEVPRALDPKEALKGAVPTQLRPVTTSRRKDVSKMSASEYRAWAKNGYK